ncbi:GNAT family N-acetyltransferase [Novosphingobium sp.]|uniref:GNAT family N-acetyltransferase n=1 Tax=Novosphingobium sp. TaxID=1874826 RepID=UPI0025F8C8BF|nr:GNAT family N-acetyltransferase [Novosphingobium sp.]
MLQPDFDTWRQPTLTGEGLLLRPLAPQDWDALYAVASDPLIWELHPAHDRWREPVFRDFFANALKFKGAVVVIDLANEAIIGSSRWQGFDPERSSVEIGWTFLARKAWGGTWNRELKRLMIGHALQHVELVEFQVGEANVRSRRALEKIGGRLTDRTSVVDMADGPVRHVIYEITRDSFANGPLAGL